ncbi:MAG TPA: DNA-binding domain-containing protein [Steroidobacteraceae bacterium]|nr:DNA-binding domain-containing protein [Steroidobacteraceae bacterium]
MLMLRDLQRAFVQGALSDAALSSICAEIIGAGIAPERRLAIYRNNAVEGFLKTLQATFPTIVRLSGEDWFRQIGRQYMGRYPSRSGNIHYVGEHFATFLEAELEGSSYEYFADVARFEWAYQEVLVAADHPTFDLNALAVVPPEDYGALRFSTHPAMRLVHSRFPVLAIWRANQPDAAADERIALDQGSSSVLLIRRADHVELRELPAAEFALIAALVRGESLEQAAECALEIDRGVALDATLGRIVSLGTLVDFTAPSRQ